MLLKGGIQPTTWCHKLWNSSKQSVQCWQEIERIDIKCMPSENEFSTMESLLEVLKPLSIFTDALSGENHVTVSAHRPLLNHLMTKLLYVKPGSNGLLNELKDIANFK